MHGQAVEADGSGRLCDQVIQDRKIMGRIGRKNRGVAQSKGFGWGGSWDTAGDGEIPRKKVMVGQG